MTGPTVEQLHADYQAKLRRWHDRHGSPRSTYATATVTTLRPAVFTGTGGK